MVIDSDAGCQISSFVTNLATYFIENTHQITTTVENGVNVQAQTSFINMPVFRFKHEED